MTKLRSRLDRNRKGTHYSDRMHRILGVCQDCGMLWHDEHVTRRGGGIEIKRVDDIEPTGRVLVTPQYEKYGLRVNPRILPRLKKMATQFAYALNVPSATVEVDGNTVYIRVPRPQRDATSTITFEQARAIAPNIPRGNLLLGIDDEHQQLVIDFTSPTNAHAAAIGMTGSGKSTLMRTMILSAQLIGGAKVALFDPTNGFYQLSGHPSVWRGGLFQSPADCELGLQALARSIGQKPSGLTYVFVDEVPDLVMQRPKIKTYLARLAQAGRHAGIHLVIGAQHPLSSELGPTTLRNIPVRLVGRVADRTASYLATGRNDIRAESLRGRGDFIAVNGSTARHFQAAYLSPKTLAAWAKRYPPRPPRLPVRPALAAQPAQGAPVTWGSSGSPGRPLDDIPIPVIREIQRYLEEHGKPPSSNWVYHLTKAMLPTGGFNRAKARRAIRSALEPLDAHQKGSLRPMEKDRPQLIVRA